jgi:protein-tyrosine phosphatase
MPIRDLDVPTSTQMRATLAAIGAAIERGETIYVHCWGGIGRTGTVVGCWLVERGTDPAQGLARLCELRRHTERADRVSPETEAQQKFVPAWSA